MILWIYTCWALEFSCVIYATRCQIYWGLTHIVFAGALIWYYTHINTQNTIRGHQQTDTPTVMCSTVICLYYIEWIIHWYQKFTFHNVFSVQKLFTGKSHICWLDAIILGSSCETQILILIEMVQINKAHIYTKHSEKDSTGKC